MKIRSGSGRLLLLAGLAILTFSGCASAPPMPANGLDAYLRSRALRGDFSGAVIVAHQGKVLLDGGYGRADFELDIPNDTTRIFRIGSLSKPFTAAVIMRLQEEQKLRLEDSVCRYLNNCPPAWEPVTILHLLSHTSGIPDYFGEVSAGPVSRMREYIDEIVSAHRTSTLSTIPGESFSYSNFGYLLLGYVIEVAGNEPWPEILRTRMFTPAGMTATGYDDVFTLIPNRVHGYRREGGVLQNIVYKDHGAFAAGGLRSTARDLLAWQRALFGGSLLTSSSLEQMLTPVRDHYALGWQTITLLGKPAVNHSGGIDGFASHLVHYPDDDLTIIVLSNISNEAAKTTACDLARIAFGIDERVLDSAVSAEPSTADLPSFAGTFSDGEITRSIEVRSDRLVYLRGSTPVTLARLSIDRFAMDRTTLLTFDSERKTLTMTDGCGTVIATFNRVP